MLRFLLRRLATLPFALLLLHFLGFTYAYVTLPIRAAQTPYHAVGNINQSPLLVIYAQTLQDIFHGSLLRPLAAGPQFGSFAQTLVQALGASLGLMGITLLISVFLGISLGLLAVKNQPPGVRGWMAFISTIGLSMPSFYIGGMSILLILFVRIFVLTGPSSSAIAISGFGWDSHLILPVMALMVHPTVKTAQVTSTLLVGELDKQYIVAARSFGHTWRGIRWHYAMRNVLASIVLSIAGSFRLMVGELIVVEWLFLWPGIGNLLASTLVPNLISTELGANVLFLNPSTVAGVVTLIGFTFLITDLITHVLVFLLDPRLRLHDEVGAKEALG